MEIFWSFFSFSTDPSGNNAYDYSSKLQTAEVPIVNVDTCKKLPSHDGQTFTDNMFCAGELSVQTPSDACVVSLWY